MKTKKYILLIILTMLCQIWAFAGRTPHVKLRPGKVTNFTGSWKINEKLSIFGNVPKTASYYMIEVSQTADSIKISRFGTTKFVHTISLNGKSSFFRSDKHNRIKASSISWLLQEREMVETAVFTYDTLPKETFQKKYIENWSLSSDGKKLTIVRNMEVSDPQMNWTTKSVYDKQD